MLINWRLFYGVVLWMTLTMPSLAQQLEPQVEFDKLKNHLELIKHPEKRLAFLNTTLTTHQDWPINTKAQWLMLLAKEQKNQGDVTAAKESYSQVISMFPNQVPTEILINAYLERALMIYMQTGDRFLYCPDQESATALARQLNQPDLLVEALTNNAYCYNKASNFHVGLALLSEALVIAQDNKLPETKQAMIYNATASLYRDQGLAARAYQYYQHAMDLYRLANDVVSIFDMLHNLIGESAKLYLWKENELYLQEMAKMVKDNPKNKEFGFFYYFNAGLSAVKQQQYTTAEQLLVKAITLKEDTAEKYFVDATYAWLAISYFRQQKITQAADSAFEFINSNSFDIQHYLLQSSMLAIKEFADNHSFEAMNWLLDAIEKQQDELAQKINNDIILSSIGHSSAIAEYQNQILENELSINKLSLADEINKQQITKLTAVVVGLIGVSLLIIIVFLIYSRRKFIHLSKTDYLTQISNRLFTFEEGEKQLLASKRLNEPFAVIMFDIDHFKSINDTYGHDVGDTVIKTIGQRAKSWLKKRDILGRVGGEEFLLVLPNVTKDAATTIAERLRKSIEEEVFNLPSGECRFTISLGVAILDKHSQAFIDIVKAADDVLYQAKNNGRNLVCVA